MPLYMDLHILPGVKAKDVAEAHRRDLLVQDEHACTCMTYWIDEKRGNVFCLIDAPNKEAVEEMHGKAHGLVPNRIIEVNGSLVESFLGRISDPDDAVENIDGLKVFHDTSFRILMVTSMADIVLLEHRFGKEKAAAMHKRCYEMIRKNIAQYNGREAEHEGEVVVAAFSSAADAISCAIAMQQAVTTKEMKEVCIKTGIHAGEPVDKNENIFQKHSCFFNSHYNLHRNKCKSILRMYFLCYLSNSQWGFTLRRKMLC